MEKKHVRKFDVRNHVTTMTHKCHGKRLFLLLPAKETYSRQKKKIWRKKKITYGKKKKIAAKEKLLQQKKVTHRKRQKIGQKVTMKISLETKF